MFQIGFPLNTCEQFLPLTDKGLQGREAALIKEPKCLT